MNIGARIKEIAESKVLSTKALGDKIGRTRQAVYDIYSGKVSVNVDLLEKIAEALEVPITSFFSNIATVDNKSIEADYFNTKRAYERLLSLIEEKKYITVKTIHTLMNDIHVHACKGEGLVNLYSKYEEGRGYVLYPVYHKLKNKLSPKDETDFTVRLYESIIDNMIETKEYDDSIKLSGWTE